MHCFSNLFLIKKSTLYQQNLLHFLEYFYWFNFFLYNTEVYLQMFYNITTIYMYIHQ
jgi:hypothetical protein